MIVGMTLPQYVRVTGCGNCFSGSECGCDPTSVG